MRLAKDTPISNPVQAARIVAPPAVYFVETQARRRPQIEAVTNEIQNRNEVSPSSPTIVKTARFVAAIVAPITETKTT